MSIQTNDDNDINGFILQYAQDSLFTRVVEYLKADPEKSSNIKKIIQNRQIMDKCAPELVADILNDIIDNKGSEELYEKICGLVNEAYGENALKILRDRPWISLNDIPNFNIFDERIINIIGNGGVHSFLTYIMESEKVITEMCENPELIEQYIEFRKMTEGYFPNSAIGLEESLNAFYSHKDLINEIIEAGEQEELKNNLLLLFRDEDMLAQLSEDTRQAYRIDESAKKIFFTSNVEELKTYREKRNGFFNQSIAECLEQRGTFPKQLLLLQYFGHIRDCPGNYDEYDHEKFLTDYLMFNKNQFSEDEIDLIQLYSIIEKCRDKDVLLRLSELLGQRKDIVDPVKMKAIDEKVVESYKQEYVDGLLKIEEARDKVADANDASYMYLLRSNGDQIYKDHRVSQGKEYYSDYIKSGNDTTWEYQQEDWKKQSDNWQYISKTSKSDGRTIYEATIEDDENPDKNKKMRIEILPDGKKIYSFSYNNPSNITMSKNEKGTYIFKYTSDSNQVTTIEFDKEKKRGNYQITNTKLGNVISSDEFSTTTEYSAKSPYEKKVRPIRKMTQNCVNYTPKFEQYLDTFVKEVDKRPPKKQFDEKEFEKSDNDIEVFHLVEVDRSKLCVTVFRGGSCSESLAKIDRIKDKYKKTNLENYDFIGTLDDMVEIDRKLEGGIPSRSFYYDYDGKLKAGLGFSNINPNSIIGFKGGDAGTSHGLKELRVYMQHVRIDKILELVPTQGSEIAMLRTEWNLDDIREGTFGGKANPDYVTKGSDLEFAKKLAISYKVPIIEFEKITSREKKRTEKRRERQEGDIIKQIYSVIEGCPTEEKDLAMSRISRDQNTLFNEKSIPGQQ
ncbi:MAG: hypothetical protein J5507_05190 [Clostridia bacterium]|nr:hypothetical protein [Clostridia bacterium]